MSISTLIYVESASRFCLFRFLPSIPSGIYILFLSYSGKTFFSISLTFTLHCFKMLSQINKKSIKFRTFCPYTLFYYHIKVCNLYEVYVNQTCSLNWQSKGKSLQPLKITNCNFKRPRSSLPYVGSA